ncbi:MAG: hypothetical protein F4Y82_04945 [Cenarchaeum sp. SB0665_bin_23]|nr:hypothetical protein [Cenarchaeum sp. SB0667_bin_13]MXY61441.1 hypothetical protein [Cenarchaeum sp. SB0665_bin_23]MXZ94144.1 hypothetical protein [Cenarchaeum sp. SB0666_bin_15]MYB46196.1 hypothetical protein [Cenarchaeum sp. SB0662_bin_33]MYC79275.1 hypothetical protein [Cenarchaeum sp. SB0661_bin_35]MYD59282.1 hypothetical protein [Cenarchaeum sp. SB0678_bin_8]MYG32998.1 hypothetical protein [Cenarchaeum sp. SB0677_bin_16]MYI51286.1 hypothetical protein [Cenarchaeum sp. SB0673_bin_9]M
MEELEFKYEVTVQKREKAMRFDAATKQALRDAGMMNEKNKFKINGISPKMLRTMKQEYVECPVIGHDVQFVQCFACPNFQSRANGVVLCRGDSL